MTSFRSIIREWRSFPRSLHQIRRILDTAVKLKEYGYTEVNLNLGCPSGTVAAKGKGAGFLKDTEKLARFLGEVSEGMERENLHFFHQDPCGCGK